MFIPKRLEIDLELSALQTNSTSIAHTTLDTSKIVIVKPSKEKKWVTVYMYFLIIFSDSKE